LRGFGTLEEVSIRYVFPFELFLATPHSIETQVVQTLQNIAESHGAKFHFSSPISHILTDPSNGAATGIVLDTPEKKEIQSDLVVVNADLAYAHNNLFLETPGGKKLKEPSLAKSLRAKKHSCSSISFYWAMDRVMESLNAHNIFLVSSLGVVMIGGENC
jgi:phytoene desaturase (3,4-didehydrolycopene-forming)